MLVVSDGGDNGASAAGGDHSDSGGDGGGSFHCEAGSDRRVRFLAPGMVGCDLSEKRFLERLPLRLCQVLGANSTRTGGLWLPWGEFP